MQLLIVDDDAAHLALTTRALKNLLPIDQISTSTSPPAIDTIPEELKLLLLDFNLGADTSLAYLRELHQQRSNLLILVISTSELYTDVEQAYCAGASGYLLKNGDPEKFSENVRKGVSFYLRQRSI